MAFRYPQGCSIVRAARLLPIDDPPRLFIELPAQHPPAPCEGFGRRRYWSMLRAQLARPAGAADSRQPCDSGRTFSRASTDSAGAFIHLNPKGGDQGMAGPYWLAEENGAFVRGRPVTRWRPK